MRPCAPSLTSSALHRFGYDAEAPAVRVSAEVRLRRAGGPTVRYGSGCVTRSALNARSRGQPAALPPWTVRADGPTPNTGAASLLRATTAARSGWRSTPGCCRCGRTCRDSPGPAADSGNNPCRRQADVVVVACPTGVQERRLPSSVTGETPFVVAGSRAWRALQSGSAKPRTGRCGAAAEMPEEGLEPPTRGS